MIRFLKYLGGVLFILSLLSCRHLPESKEFRTEQNFPEKTGRMLVDDLLSRDSFMMYETEQATSIHYAEACAAYGAVQFAARTNDTVRLNLLNDRYSRVLDENIVNTANHVDANVYGILPLELFRVSGDEKFFNQGMELADGQWKNTNEDGLTNQVRFWIDDMYMITSLQVAAYRTTGDTVYLNRAARTLDVYLEKLQQPNGLFHHGEGAPFFWGRGNGWVAAGLAELLSELPETNPYYPSVLKGYTQMMNALLKYQADDGMWRQLLNVEESWKETSCTAMFGFAIHTGVRKGILKNEAFINAYQKAWNALTGYMGEDGQISDVCVGTGKSDDLNYYLERPRITGDFHGQAPMLWFANSLLEEALL